MTATTTVKETAAAVEMSMPKVLFSLSSASILLIPLSLCAMIGALIALLRKQDNVGMLFAGISCVCFALFMVFFSLEKVNPSLYTPISEQLKELGVKFKKREVERIFVNFHPMTYFALACAALTAIVAKPSYKTDSARRALKRDLLPYAYIGPHLFFFVIFFITPAIYGVYAAFTKWDLFNEPVFTGLSNFRTLLFDSATPTTSSFATAFGTPLSSSFTACPSASSCRCRWLWRCTRAAGATSFIRRCTTCPA